MDRMVRFLHIAARTTFTVIVIGPFLPVLILADVMLWPFFGYGFIGVREAASEHGQQFKQWCGWHLCKSNARLDRQEEARP